MWLWYHWHNRLWTVIVSLWGIVVLYCTMSETLAYPLVIVKQCRMHHSKQRQRLTGGHFIFCCMIMRHLKKTTTLITARQRWRCINSLTTNSRRLLMTFQWRSFRGWRIGSPRLSLILSPTNKKLHFWSHCQNYFVSVWSRERSCWQNSPNLFTTLAS